MKLGNLKDIDSTFLIVMGDVELDILGITDNYDLKKQHFVFIKNKNFLNDWFLNKKIQKSTGLVFEKKFFDSLDLDLKQNVLEQSYFTATVEDVASSMSYLSKPFYDEKIRNINDIVDGRQMGSAQIDPSAFIAQGVFIGENVLIEAEVKIHPGVVIMSGVKIGSRSEIFSNTVIYRDVKIGSYVRIHGNCTIGADGFGYHFKNGQHLKIWHMGSVEIGNDVEIGAGTCIDGGTFSKTIIGAGTKIDNQVQVGHNCRLGMGVIICGQAGLAGSCTVGDFVVIGGAAKLAPGVTVGKGTQIAGGSGVTNNLGAGEIVGGLPARNIKEWMRGVAMVRKLSLKTKD